MHTSTLSGLRQQEREAGPLVQVFYGLQNLLCFVVSARVEWCQHGGRAGDNLGVHNLPFLWSKIDLYLPVIRRVIACKHGSDFRPHISL
jgi:hypothetical protein